MPPNKVTAAVMNAPGRIEAREPRYLGLGDETTAQAMTMAQTMKVAITP